MGWEIKEWGMGSGRMSMEMGGWQMGSDRIGDGKWEKGG